MSTYSLADITLRGGDWGERSENDPPAINVKVQRYARDGAAHGDPWGVIAEDFGTTEAAAEKALGLAFEHAQAEFWEELAPELWRERLAPAFEGAGCVESDGRSGGWLIVTGLPPVGEWTSEQINAWGVFEESILQTVESLSSFADARQRMLDNGWLQLQKPPTTCPSCGSGDVRIEINYRFEYQRAYSTNGRTLLFDGTRADGNPEEWRRWPVEDTAIPFEAALACAECGVETPIDTAAAQAFVDTAQELKYNAGCDRCGTADRTPGSDYCADCLDSIETGQDAELRRRAAEEGI